MSRKIPPCTAAGFPPAPTALCRRGMPIRGGRAAPAFPPRRLRSETPGIARPGRRLPPRPDGSSPRGTTATANPDAAILRGMAVQRSRGRPARRGPANPRTPPRICGRCKIDSDGCRHPLDAGDVTHRERVAAAPGEAGRPAAGQRCVTGRPGNPRGSGRCAPSARPGPPPSPRKTARHTAARPAPWPLRWPPAGGGIWRACPTWSPQA